MLFENTRCVPKIPSTIISSNSILITMNPMYTIKCNTATIGF